MADPERASLVQRAFDEYATGRDTKEQLLKQTAAWGVTNRRGRPLTSQAIGMLLRNRLYAGIVDVPEYGVRAKRGDFEPLISEDLFYRVQGVLAGRVPSTTRPSSVRTRISHSALSYAASPVDAASPAVGRRGAGPLNRSGASRRRGPSLSSDTARRRWLVPRQEVQWSRATARGGTARCGGSGRRCDRQGASGRQT